MKPSVAFVILLLFSTLLIAGIPSIPKTNAATPTIVHTGSCSTFTAVCSGTITAVTGDYIVVAAAESCVTFGGSPFGFSDSQGNTYTTGATGNVCGGLGSGAGVMLAYAVALSSGTDTIHIQWSGYVCNSFFPCPNSAKFFDVNNINQISPIQLNQCYYTVAGCHQGHNNKAAMNTASSFDASNAFLLSVGINVNGGSTGYHYSALPQGGGVQWNTTGSPTNPTFYEMNNNTRNWSEAALGSITVNETVVVPCNFFQLQCWWYPMAFFGIYSVGFLIVGAVGKVTSKAMTYLMLMALVFASLIEVQMGMINIMYPLIFTFLSVVYMVRAR